MRSAPPSARYAPANPESWTHGASEQRVTWFKRGLQSGRIEDCDTFKE